VNQETWKPEPITLSGVTDCYQPAERRFRLTRGCLEVAAEARQPVSVITKNALVLRDLDLLADLARGGLVHVTVSVTTLDAGLARSMEPRTSTPAARLRGVEALARAGVPVRALIAPVVPGLNDSEIPDILGAARGAGARAAGYVLLRLPLAVSPVFREWLRREQPGRAERVEGRVRQTRGGRLNDGEFGRRMCGTGRWPGRSAGCSGCSPGGTGWTARCPPTTAATSARRGPGPGSCGCSDPHALKSRPGLGKTMNWPASDISKALSSESQSTNHCCSRGFSSRAGV
jgi:DNA repair photolyase